MVTKKCEIVFEENDGILNVSATQFWIQWS